MSTFKLFNNCIKPLCVFACVSVWAGSIEKPRRHRAHARYGLHQRPVMLVNILLCIWWFQVGTALHGFTAHVCVSLHDGWCKLSHTHREREKEACLGDSFLLNVEHVQDFFFIFYCLQASVDMLKQHFQNSSRLLLYEHASKLNKFVSPPKVKSHVSKEACSSTTLAPRDTLH